MRASLLPFARLSAVLAATLVGALAACGDDPAPDAPAADAGEEPYDVCNEFTTSGASCAVISDRRCFPVCATGGCRCLAGPAGEGVWECTNDFSCYPDSAPSQDAPFQDVQPIYDAPRDTSNDDADAGEPDGSDAADAG